MNKFIPSLLVLLIGGMSFAQKATDLKLDFREGQSISEEMKMTTAIDQTMPSGSLNFTTTVNTFTSYHVAESTDQQFKLGVRYKRFITETEGMGRSQVVDTDSIPEGDASAAVLNDLIDHEFYMTLTPRGEVLNVTGLEDLWNDQDTTKTPMERMAMKKMQTTFGGEAFKKTLEKSLNIYPAEDVNPGESWTMSSSAEVSGIVMQVENTYTLDQITDEHYIVKVSGSIKSDPDKSIEQGGVEMKMTMSGNTNGVMHLDKQTKWPLKSNMTQSMQGNISAQGMEIPMKVTTKIEMDATIE